MDPLTQQLLFDDDDEVLAELLLERQKLLTLLDDILDESDSEDECTKSKARTCKRIDKTSQHWETECQTMSEASFCKRFRMSQSTFRKLLDMIKDTITVSNFANDAVAADKRLAITLRYLGSGADITMLADLFGLGETTIRTIIKQVVTAIAGCEQLQDLVQFPSTEDEFSLVAKRFFDRFQFPNCVGAVDDTHISIMKPSAENDPSSYLDYKKDYSIHLQAVCDADTRVLFYHVGAPGKNNDGGVMELSGLKNLLEEGRVPARYHLIGDPAFPLHVNLLTRFPGLLLTEFESRSRYNWRQSRSRMIIEQLFGDLSASNCCKLLAMQF